MAVITGLGLGMGLLAPAGPPPGTDLDYQLGGSSRPADRVGIVVRDRKAEPADGLWNVCYVNGFQTQPDELPFWRKRRALLLEHRGEFVVDEAWGERILDIRTADKRLRLARIVGRWARRCARDGFDAVEFDNLDSFMRSEGLVRRAHAKKYARLLTRAAHRAGLAAGQKNWAGFDGRRVGFDFAIAEECGRYDECDRYVTAYGSAVLVVEYRRKDFRKACASHGDRLPIVLRDRDLTPRGRRAWC